MKDYSERLRYALVQRSMSQSDLAREIGVKPQAIQYLCRKGMGKRSVHSSKIAEVLQINANWLTDGVGEMDLYQTDSKQAFSNRLNLVLDHVKFPKKGEGRQGELAKIFHVSDKGARKWIEGEAIPSASKHLPAIANEFNVTAEWLLTGNNQYAPEWYNPQKSDEINDKKGGYNLKKDNLKKQNIDYIPCIKWTEIRAFTHSDYSKKQEFEMMPVVEKLRDGSFSVQIEGTQYSPYLNENDIIVVEPTQSTLNHRVLAEINGQYHIMEHVLLEKEYFFPKKTGAVPIPITNDLDYKILGIIKSIYSKRNG